MSIRLNLKANRTVKPNTLDPFFEVDQIPLVRVDGVETNLRALVNKETGKQLGVVTNQYNVFTHREASETVKDFLTGAGLSFESKIKDTASAGSRFFETLVFPSLSFNPSKGQFSDALDSKNLQVDTYIPSIQIRNSYDRTLGLSWTYGLYRVVCQNGMAVQVKGSEEKLSFKHSQIVNRDLVYAHLVSNLEKSSLAMEKAFVSLNGQKGEDLLQSALANRFSDRYKKYVLDKLGANATIEGAVEEQEDGSTVWTINKINTELSAYAIYNVLTEVNTHQIMNPMERSANDRKIANIARISA